MLLFPNRCFSSTWLILTVVVIKTVGKPATFSKANDVVEGERNSRLKCGTIAHRKSRIVGGEDAFENEFSWIASVRDSVMGHFCGAFVISDRHLISAAHCFKKKNNNNFLNFTDSGEVIVSSVKVTLGLFNFQSLDKSITVPVEKLVIHPDYKHLTKENDIAIIQLGQSGISIHPGVEPICLPSIEYRSELNKGTVTHGVSIGWGKTKPDQDYWNWVDTVSVLKKVNVPLLPSRVCTEEYAKHKFPSKAFICAGEYGRGSCDGDSGGPLQIINENNRWTAIGVVSGGKKCGSKGKPGIFTDIVSHLDWIIKSMQN